VAGLDLDFASPSAGLHAPAAAVQEAVEGEQAAAGPAVRAAEEGAGEWEQHVSQSKGGLIYYYNRRTGETTWQTPWNDPPSLSSARRRPATPVSQHPEAGHAAPPAAFAPALGQSDPIIHANEVPAPRVITMARPGASGAHATMGRLVLPASARLSAKPSALAVDYPRFLSAREGRRDWPGLDGDADDYSRSPSQPRLALYPNATAGRSKTPRPAGTASAHLSAAPSPALLNVDRTGRSSRPLDTVFSRRLPPYHLASVQSPSLPHTPHARNL